MKRALLCLSAFVGLSLGYCSHPREIRSATTVAKVRAERAARPAVRVAIEYVVDAAVNATSAVAGKPASGM